MISTFPVSLSTSTSQMWQPFGYVGSLCSYELAPSSIWVLDWFSAILAIENKSIFLLVPCTWKRGPDSVEYSISSIEASNSAAAISIPFFKTSSDASLMAPAAKYNDFDPPVPPPLGKSSLSPKWIDTSSGLTPNFSTTICVHAVSWPWPVAIVPV